MKSPRNLDIVPEICYNSKLDESVFRQETTEIFIYPFFQTIKHDKGYYYTRILLR